MFQTKVQLKSSITLSMMKSRKEKMISPIHISTDEQISRHFGKASIQDERVCILKLDEGYAAPSPPAGQKVHTHS
jgi:hypothetical protein